MAPKADLTRRILCSVKHGVHGFRTNGLCGCVFMRKLPGGSLERRENSGLRTAGEVQVADGVVGSGDGAGIRQAVVARPHHFVLLQGSSTSKPGMRPEH